MEVMIRLLIFFLVFLVRRHLNVINMSTIGIPRCTPGGVKQPHKTSHPLPVTRIKDVATNEVLNQMWHRRYRCCSCRHRFRHRRRQ